MKSGLSILLYIVLATASVSLAGGTLTLDWSTIDGGGGSSSGGGYALGGTIGQPDAGIMNGGAYTLVGGFWNGAGAVHKVYLPLIVR